ncbi:MAG TPA: glycosyltransferase, partial [Candidatus Tectomicrobia bacterium]|nr:glycosyltransferase [Candidatus Tectomicrobia bacterium]
MSRGAVVHVVRSLELGGLENGVVNVVSGLHGNVEQVVVCLTRAGAFAARLPAGIRVIELGLADRDRLAAVRLARLFRSLRPRLVHSRNWPTIDAIPAARLAGVPVVVHGEHGREASDPEGRDRRRNRVRRLLAPLVDRFVAVSQDLAGWLARDVRIPGRKIATILNGVDTARFSPGDREAGRRALGVTDGSIVVGTVGRLDPVKDHGSLLAAFASLGPRRPDVVLAVVGDGPCRGDLERQAMEAGLAARVRFLGARDDVPALLRGMDVFVLPSIAEGISNTILEA